MANRGMSPDLRIRLNVGFLKDIHLLDNQEIPNSSQDGNIKSKRAREKEKFFSKYLT